MTESQTGRDNYHHGDLRQAILAAACQHLKHENADTLSLRALAREIGVSQTAPYRHFDSKNALFAAIAIWGFEMLGDQLVKACAGLEDDVTASMIAIGMAYLEFSQAHPEKYQLFLDSSLVEFDEYTELQEASSNSFEIMMVVIRRGKASGEFFDRPEEELAAIFWSGLHGIASLLQINHKREGFDQRAVGKAVKFLATSQQKAVESILGMLLKAS